MKDKKYRIMIIDAGNTDRSPFAAAYLQSLLGTSKYIVDSRGTAIWNENFPDSDWVEVTKALSGIDIAQCRPERVKPKELGKYDLVIVTDRSKIEILKAHGAPNAIETFIVIPMRDPEVQPRIFQAVIANEIMASMRVLAEAIPLIAKARNA